MCFSLNNILHKILYMNIIIPLGGKGERFSKNGYVQPKPLIKIFEKFMIDYLIDNLTISENDKIFIIYNKYLDDYAFPNHIFEKYPFINLIKINDTKGAAETLFIGLGIILNNFKHHNKSIVLDCDTFYTYDILDVFRNSTNNIIFYRKNYDNNSIYSYININNENEIIDIAEKVKISNNANTGAYAFNDINILYDYCKYVIDNNITFKNEPFTSCVIAEMIKNSLKFTGFYLSDNNVFSLGTPNEVNTYIKNTYAFLFDLDGTLVITDKIYYDVWHEILLVYNIYLDEEIFKKYIQGNNDKFVISTLLKNVNITLSDLSKLKDELFIKNIQHIKIIDGLYELFNKIKSSGHKLCIVTNCNRKVAESIIKYINVENLVDFIISSEDCKNGKPSSEPYKNAIQRYNIKNNKYIIFEDSKTGILSGKGTEPKFLIGIQSIYNNDELINYGCDLSIKNYINFNIDNYLSNPEKNDTQTYLKELIKKNNFMLDIKNIVLDDTKLKGGFIADVVSYKIITSDKTYSQILKYENKNENELNKIAKKLDLYNREYYFYTDISKYVNIKIPVFYNLLNDNNSNTIGIVLENLTEKGFKINLDLNYQSIDVTLKIVDRMAKLHSKFWNKNLKEIFPKLKCTTDDIFYPFLYNFIEERYDTFKNNWHKILNNYQNEKCDEIYKNFINIQKHLSNNNLTFIHGDIKSPNIFYDVNSDYEPYFIDWQHCAIGKGCQDLVFFIIESFDIINIKTNFNITIEYYYKKLIEYGVYNYSYKDYEKDLYYAVCYIPFFTSVWFGSTPQDELIDKNFPYFFIYKLFYLIEYINSTKKIDF